MLSLIESGRFDLPEFVLTLFFGSTFLRSIVTEILYIAGTWKILEKSGIKGWWSLIPCAREYQISQCAGREPEGRVLSVTLFFQRMINVFGVIPLLAVSGDSMDFNSATMILLLGGSGAGKTIYLNAVNGYEKAKAEVLLNGSNMYKEYGKMQYEVGFVPQYGMMRKKDTVIATMMDTAGYADTGRSVSGEPR